MQEKAEGDHRSGAKDRERERSPVDVRRLMKAFKGTATVTPHKPPTKHPRGKRGGQSKYFTVKGKIEGGSDWRTANIDIWSERARSTGRNRRRGWNKAARQAADS